MKKNFIRIIVILVVLSIFPQIVVGASSYMDILDSNPAFSELSAKSFYLMDGLTKTALSSKNPDLPLPMASTTKIMTCIVALEKAALSDIVMIPKEAVGIEGSSVYLVEGECLTLEELLFALMLESANDAAIAIALHVCDDVDAFVDLMNEKAVELGMFGTHFVNPHGLPAEGHVSTAKDLCLLLSYALKNNAFSHYSGTKSITIDAPNSSKRFLSNHNKLLRIYDSCIAGKTGYTKEAGRCLVTAAEKNGRILICATLGDPNDWNDHISLFEYGFSLYEETLIFSEAELTSALPVVGGEQMQVLVSNKEGFSFWLKYDEIYKMEIELPAFEFAPVYEGDVLGEAVISVNGIEVRRIELFAKSTVTKRNDKLSFWENILQKIKIWMD